MKAIHQIDMEYRGLTTVISGGQTGADQAGLLAAKFLGLRTGGTAPDGWYTDTGPNILLKSFGMSAAGDYRSRTIANVRNSDGTLLLSLTLNSPGSKLTRNEARRQGKPFFEFDITELMRLSEGSDDFLEYTAARKELVSKIQSWILAEEIQVLNVAGNREKDLKHFSTTQLVQAILMETFAGVKATNIETGI